MQAFAAELAGQGRKLVPVLQPGVKVDPGYETYLDGLAQAAFLRGQDQQPYLGWVSSGSLPHFVVPLLYCCVASAALADLPSFWAGGCVRAPHTRSHHHSHTHSSAH
jgi:hypothetical protein